MESFPTEALEALATAGPVTVEVQRCERLRTTVICHLSLENTGPDRQFLIDDKWHIDPTPLEGDTRIIDDKGNAYLVANIRIANFPPDRKSGGVKATLVSNVPTPATLAFNGVPEGVAKIVRLDVRSWLTRSDDRVLTFRNIPIV